MSASKLIHQLESSSRKEINYFDRSVIQRHGAELLSTLDHTSNIKKELKQGFTVRDNLNGMHSSRFLEAKQFSEKQKRILQKTIDEINVQDADFIKKTIEEYWGVNNLTNWGSALLNFVEIDLVLFYHLIAQKSTFDIQELDKVKEFCVLYFCQYLFNIGRMTKGLHYLHNAFGLDDSTIYRICKKQIDMYMVNYIENKGLTSNKKFNKFDVQTLQDILADIKSGGYFSAETLVSFLLEVNIIETAGALKQLRNIAEEADDVGLVARIDWHGIFGKDIKFPDRSGACTYVRTGTYKNKSGIDIKTQACLTKVNNQFILFENKALRGKVDEETAKRLEEVAPIVSDVIRGYKTTVQAEEILKKGLRKQVIKQYRTTVASILKIKYNDWEVLN